MSKNPRDFRLGTVVSNDHETPLTDYVRDVRASLDLCATAAAASAAALLLTVLLLSVLMKVHLSQSLRLQLVLNLAASSGFVCV